MLNPVMLIRLPQRTGYSRTEVVSDLVVHAVGLTAAVLAVPVLVIRAWSLGSGPVVVTGVSIYGATLLIMFTVSSIYHGLPVGNAKRVMRVIDHCDIYFLIAGTYTPILLTAIRPLNPEMAWSIFGVEWALTAIAVTLNAIDLKRFEKVSMVCYIGMGWAVLPFMKQALVALTLPGFLWLLFGGIAYTIGAVLFAIGSKRRWFHSVFHIFVVLGSLLQFVSVLFYAL